jgi:amino acid adenylation domain-containing protein
VPELLQDWVTIQAEARPNELAVVLGDETLTYSQLDILSNRLARLLRAAGCQKGDRVCLLMPKSPAAIAGLLGIYKADCIYVPLDPSSPRARLEKVVSACAPKLILVDSHSAQLLDELLAGLTAPAETSIGWMDAAPAPAFSHSRVAFTLRDAEGLPSGTPEYQNKRSDAAHILFTSGSTGNPKGVVITHGNVIEFVEWTVRYFGIEPSDRNSGHPPLPFDLSFLDIFATFAAGARLYPVPTDLNITPAKMADFIRQNELTQWFSVPSALHYMAKFDVVRKNDFPHLRRLLWCGEVFPTASLIYWMERLPHVQFTNLYGPTETTIASSYYTIPECPASETAPIPIGTACGGEELLVLNDELERVPPGVVGNLFIGGAGLSQGYWNDPENTARAFVRSPFSSDPNERIYKTGDLARVGDDGLVYFLGRNDTQIKSRGYRIELGEIEAALNTIPGLQESAVVAIGGRDTAIICCAYAPKDGGQVSPAAVRKLLSDSVPNYMLPVRWRTYSTLPKNSSGKIDRRALKEDFIAGEAAAAPQPSGVAA